MLNENLWFVAKDVCDALTIGNSRDALNRLDDEKAMLVLPTQFGDKEMNLVNESGLYNLIFQSRKPEAKKFRKWVTCEILPILRKTGRYELPSRRRALPRDKSAAMAEFFDELTRWTTHDDEKVVAEMLNVGVKHVHEVVRGRSQSYGVACMLVEFAKENRRNGVQRVLRSVSRDSEMRELMLEFTEEGM